MKQGPPTTPRSGRLLPLCLFALAAVAAQAAPEPRTLPPKEWISQAKELNPSSEMIQGPVYETVLPLKSAHGHYVIRYETTKDRDYLAAVRPDLFVVPFNKLRLEGFTRRKIFGEDDRALYLVAPRDESPTQASIEWTVTESRWRQFLTIVQLDSWRRVSTGEERLAVYLNDKLLGRIHLGNRGLLPHAYPYSWFHAGKAGNVPMELNFNSSSLYEHYRYVYTLREPLNLNKGDRLRIVAETPGVYSLTELILSSTKDSVPPVPFEIRYPEALTWPADSGRPPLEFAWTTSHSSRGGVLYGADRQAVEGGKGYWVGEEFYVDNHRAYADALPDGTNTVYYRVYAESNDGQRIVSPVLSAPLSRPQKPSGEVTGSLQYLESAPSGNPAPAYASIPLPKGMLFSTADMKLLDHETGSAVPTQWRVVSEYDDGSVRWLGGHFTARPGGKYDYTSAPGTAEAQESLAEPPLILRTEDGRLTIEGASLQAVFSPDQPGGVAEIRIASPDGMGKLELLPDSFRIVMTDPDGQRFTLSPPASMKVERSGPESIMIRTEGHFTDGGGKTLLHYVARWHFYRSLPGLDLQITVGNDRTDQPGRTDRLDDGSVVYFKNLYIETAVPGGGMKWTYDVDGKPVAAPGGNWRITQIDDQSFVLADGAKKSGRIGNSLLGSGTSGGTDLAFRVENFWQQYPKSFGVEDGTVRIGLMPTLDASWHPNKPDPDYLKFFYYIKNGSYRFAHGTRKTHRILMAVGGGAAAFAGKNLLLNAEHILTPPPADMCATGVFGPIIPRDGSYAPLDGYIDTLLQSLFKTRETNREYGLLNFGDWHGERGVNWGNQEYDIAQGTTQEFLRTGGREWLQTAYDATQNQVDVSTINYGRNAGMQVMHASAKTGIDMLVEEDGLTRDIIKTWFEKKTPFQPYNQNFHAGHMFGTGIAHTAALTGSERLRDALRLHADNRARLSVNSLPSEHHRSWNLLTLSSAYAFEPDPYYKNGARIAFDRYAADLEPWSIQPWPEFINSQSHRPLRALMRFQDVIGDERYRDLYLHLGGFLSRRWDPEAWRILDAHGLRPRQYNLTGLYLTESFLEYHRLTGNPKYMQRALQHLQGALELSRHLTAKELSMYLQFVSWVPHYLKEAGIKEIDQKPVPESVLKSRLDGVAKWNAEPFEQSLRNPESNTASKPADE